MTKKRRAWNAKPWSKEQIAWLRANIENTPRLEMARHLSCSLTLLFRRISALDIDYAKRCREWTKSEDETLRAMAGKFPVAEIAARLNRRIDGVTNRARNYLHVSLIRKRFWPDEADAELRERVARGECTRTISEQMKRSQASICARVRKLKLRANRRRMDRKPPASVQVARPRSPRAETTLRMHTGIARVSSVAWCSRCYAPVVDKPEAWAEHNRRVHITPIRRIA